VFENGCRRGHVRDDDVDVATPSDFTGATELDLDSEST
jgi:hypothetical protein